MQSGQLPWSPRDAQSPGHAIRQAFHFRAAPLDTRTHAVCQQMLSSLQRDMLILLVVMGVFFALFTGAQLVQGIWVTHTLPLAMLLVHIVRVVSIVSLVLFFAWRD